MQDKQVATTACISYLLECEIGDPLGVSHISSFQCTNVPSKHLQTSSVFQPELPAV